MSWSSQRSRATGITLLCVALAGSAYAALQLAESSGAATGRDRAAPTAKASAISGVRRWAHVDQNGRLIGASPGGRSSLVSSGKPTIYRVSWGMMLGPGCVPMVSEEFNPGPGQPVGEGGPSGVLIESSSRFSVLVRTYAPTGVNHREPFYVEVICP